MVFHKPCLRIISVWLALLMLPSCVDSQASTPDRSAEAGKTRAHTLATLWAISDGNRSWIESETTELLSHEDVDLALDATSFFRKLDLQAPFSLEPSNAQRKTQ